MEEKLLQTKNIKKQTFANISLYSPIYSFSISHVQMGELDHKKKLSVVELVLSNCGAADSWESLE